MLSFFISLLVFGFAVYLFMITLKRIKQFENGALDAKLKKEMENLIIEFNAAATRNISLLETKIEELQRLIQKANQKIIQLDEKIERSQRPIVVEKIIEKTSPQIPEETKNLDTKHKTQTSPPSPPPKKAQPLSREDQLKYYLREGKTKEELLAMGFFENEINLVKFLYKNEINS